MAFYLEYAALSLTHSSANYELCSIFHLFIHLFAYRYLPSARLYAVRVKSLHLFKFLAYEILRLKTPIDLFQKTAYKSKNT